MSPQLFLDPVDVWLFRDGRPFSAGSDHRAESLFPPYPTVLQGAIRSYQLALKGVNLHDKDAVENAVGSSTDYGSLRLRGPFLARRSSGTVERFFPQPADAVSVGTHQIERSDKPAYLPAGIKTSCPTPQLIGFNDPLRKGEGGLWLSENQLKGYLDGKRAEAVESKDLFLRESRFGIGMDSALGTTLKGALYEVVFIRPCEGVGLTIEMDGYPGWPQSGLLSLGGESRAAAFEQYEQIDELPWLTPAVKMRKRFKLYFATPAYFEAGWQPQSWVKFFTQPVELKAAAVNRFESVGGFDWAADPNKQHRAARRFVPAGSVYYFESDGTANLRETLIQNAVTDFGSEIGFGQVLVKEW